MTLQRAALILIGIATAALAACSSSGIPAPSSSSVSASVTQPAPSVWSAPESNTNSLFGAAGSTTDDPGSAASTSELPGLSTACSAAIRAQLAVNGLFSEALKGGGATATTGAARTVAPASPPSTATSPAATESRAANITKERVTEVFDELRTSIPMSLSKPLATLRAAADSIVGKSVGDVPEVLNSAENLDAMRALSTYITSCEPTTTE